MIILFIFFIVSGADKVILDTIYIEINVGKINSAEGAGRGVLTPKNLVIL